MALDTSAQVYADEATGWQRGLYADVRRTFRAPFVNWIFRTAMANDPEFLRYAWPQVKPLFETEAFAQFAVDYRETVRDALDLPTYRRATLDLRPPEYRELRGQLATFDVVAPRLAVLFETLDRTLGGERVGGAAGDAASMAPAATGLDRDRGLEPTLVGFTEVPEGLAETVAEIKAHHGYDEGLPSIYRCLAQWPPFLTRAWAHLTDDGTALATARERAADRVEAYVDGVAHTPRTTPADLDAVGLGDATADMATLFAGFNEGGRRTLPMLVAYAALAGASGQAD
jgi:hypothetical protein